MMKRYSPDEIMDRQLELNLEECAAQVEAPDRLQQILARAAGAVEPEAEPVARGRGSRLLVAAMVIAAVGVTSLVFFAQRGPDGGAEADGAARVLASQQDPVRAQDSKRRKAAEQGAQKSQEKQAQQDKQDKQDKQGKNGKSDKTKADPVKQAKAPRPQVRRVELVPQDQAPPRPAPQFNPFVRRADTAEAKRIAEQLAKLQVALRGQAGNLRGGRLGRRGRPTSPLLEGKLGVAIQDLVITANQLRMAKDLGAAKQLTDQLELKLVKLRAEIFAKQKAAAGK